MTLIGSVLCQRVNNGHYHQVLSLENKNIGENLLETMKEKINLFCQKKSDRKPDKILYFWIHHSGLARLKGGGNVTRNKAKCLVWQNWFLRWIPELMLINFISYFVNCIISLGTLYIALIFHRTLTEHSCCALLLLDTRFFEWSPFICPSWGLSGKHA